LALGRGGERDHAEHARADALGDRLDDAAFPGPVAPLEDDADLESLVLYPFLQLDELDMQLRQLPLVGPAPWPVAVLAVVALGFALLVGRCLRGVAHATHPQSMMW